MAAWSTTAGSVEIVVVPSGSTTLVRSRGGAFLFLSCEQADRISGFCAVSTLCALMRIACCLNNSVCCSAPLCKIAAIWMWLVLGLVRASRMRFLSTGAILDPESNKPLGCSPWKMALGLSCNHLRYCTTLLTVSQTCCCSCCLCFKGMASLARA